MDLMVKNNFKKVILFAFVFFSSQTVADSVSDAVSAGKNNDHAEAVRIWTELADEGNTYS